jgi:hypothetical protein
MINIVSLCRIEGDCHRHLVSNVLSSSGPPPPVRSRAIPTPARFEQHVRQLCNANSGRRALAEMNGDAAPPPRAPTLTRDAGIPTSEAELIAGGVRSLDPALAADGVDEALQSCVAPRRRGGSLTCEGVPGRVEATDAAMAWHVGCTTAVGSPTQASPRRARHPSRSRRPARPPRPKHRDRTPACSPLLDRPRTRCRQP